MKKLIMMITLIAAALGQANAGAADAVYARVLDTEAMSWAWRIEKGQGLTYADLERNSANWGRGEAVRGRLLGKVKEILNTGGVRRLTVKEENALEGALAEARGGSRNKGVDQRKLKQAAVDSAARGMVDAEAKYWAWRIAVKRDVTYNELKAKSEGWMRGAEVSNELLEKVLAKLQSGETSEPSVAERAKMDLGNKKIKEIVTQA